MEILDKFKKGKVLHYRCKCECGNIWEPQCGYVKFKNVTSCPSCSTKRGNTKHGFTGTKLHAVLNGIKQRCSNPKASGYEWYGGKGVSVCDEWKNDFLSFKTWAEENGYREGLTIDRIDASKNYEPTNCRWITQEENTRRASHRSNIDNNKTIKISEEQSKDIVKKHKEENKTMKELAIEYNVSQSCINHIVRGERLCPST